MDEITDPGMGLHSELLVPVSTYFLLLSVSVMPCEETLKCTTVVFRLGSLKLSKVTLMALATAWGPVRDSVSTELMNRTLQAANRK